VCLDEEGLVQRGMDELVSFRSSEEVMRLLSYYFVWGEQQEKAFVDKYNKFKNIIKISGERPATIEWE